MTSNKVTECKQQTDAEPLKAAVGSMWTTNSHAIYMVTTQDTHVNLVTGKLFEYNFAFAENGWKQVFCVTIEREAAE